MISASFLIPWLFGCSPYPADSAEGPDGETASADTWNGFQDQDGDGYTSSEGDCDDSDASIHPGAADFPFDDVDADCDGHDVSTGEVQGTREDEGLGSSLAWHPDGTLLAGAPYGDPSRVYAVAAQELTPLLEGEGRDLLGAGLVVSEAGEVRAGAPWHGDRAGRVLDEDGEVLATGNAAGTMLGARLDQDETGWIATTASGWQDHEGETGASTTTPSSVLRMAGEPLLGLAWGENCLEGTALSLPRPADPTSGLASEAGYALARGDLDGDGEQDLAVGGPGSGGVWILPAGEAPADLDNAVSEGTVLLVEGNGGRFGHALAVADVDGDGIDDLVVGAPLEGEDLQGAVYLFTGPLTESAGPEAATWSASGEHAMENLGTAVAATPGGVAAGGPGGGGDAGWIRTWGED